MICNTFLDILKDCDVSHSQLMDVLNLSKGTVSKKLAGKLRFSIEEVEKVLKYLNYTVIFLEKIQ